MCVRQRENLRKYCLFFSCLEKYFPCESTAEHKNPRIDFIIKHIFLVYVLNANIRLLCCWERKGKPSLPYIVVTFNLFKLKQMTTNIITALRYQINYCLSDSQFIWFSMWTLEFDQETGRERGEANTYFMDQQRAIDFGYLLSSFSVEFASIIPIFLVKKLRTGEDARGYIANGK